MIKSIVKDINFLSKKSTEANKNDLYIVNDLLDTLKIYRDNCLGLASNMIGYLKRIIVVVDNGLAKVMINPLILEKEDPYFTLEGCLSLKGTRNTIRYNKIKVTYRDEKFKMKTESFSSLTAQIIQHELDHLEGIII